MDMIKTQMKVYTYSNYCVIGFPGETNSQEQPIIKICKSLKPPSLIPQIPRGKRGKTGKTS